MDSESRIELAKTKVDIIDDLDEQIEQLKEKAKTLVSTRKKAVIELLSIIHDDDPDLFTPSEEQGSEDGSADGGPSVDGEGNLNGLELPENPQE